MENIRRSWETKKFPLIQRREENFFRDSPCVSPTPHNLLHPPSWRRNLLCRLERTFSLFESIRIEFLPKIKWEITNEIFHYLKFSTVSTQLGVEIWKLCDIFGWELFIVRAQFNFRWYFKWTFRGFYHLEIIFLFHLICNENLRKFKMRGEKMWGERWTFRGLKLK